MTELKAVLRLRTGSYDEFYNANQVCALGEHTHVTSGSHAGKWKVGDGITAWRNLPFSPRDRTVGGNDNATGTVTDTGDNLSVPVPVTVAAPSASSTQVTAGTRSLRATLKFLFDNIAWIFTNKANLASPVFTGTPKVPEKTAAAGTDGTLIATEAQVSASVAAAKLSLQIWLAAVNTKADLPNPSALEPGVNYLCRVMTDSNPANIGVWQLISGAAQWTYFSDNLDFIDQTELEAALAANVSDRNAAIAAAAALKQDKLSRTVGGDDSAVGTVTDTGGNLSVPIPLATAAPSSSDVQTVASTGTLRAKFKVLVDNIAWIFTNKANLASPVFTGTPKVPEKTAAAGTDGTLIATEAQVSASVGDEAARAQEAESGLQTAVNSEAQARAGAVGTLQDNIDSLARSTEASISAEEEAREADVSAVAEFAEAAQASADLAQETADDALSNAASAAQDAANAQHAADTAQDTADEKVDAAYVGNAIAQAQLSVQTWLPAVQTKADLPDPSTLSHSTSYLCRVINDTDTPANNGVWQLVAGAEEWTYFSDNLDFIDETELEAALAEKVDSSSTGTIAEDTDKFPASAVITFANFFKAVVAKINGIITALAGKQPMLASGTSIKTVNGTSLLGSGDIAVTASNFGGFRQDFYNVVSGTQFTLSLNTAWGNNSRSGVLQIMASAEYGNGYAKVFIACNSGTANSYAAKILETYQSTTQSNDHLFEVVSAAGGVLTIKVLNPDSRYSQKIHVAWDAQSDWPLAKV